MKRLCCISLAIMLMLGLAIGAVADVISIDTETATIEEISEAIERLKALMIERNGGIEPGLTLDNYNMIEEGMTYEEVVRLFGDPGTVQMEFDFGSPESKTTNYIWGNGLSYVGITFSGGKVASKMQFGLK